MSGFLRLLAENLAGLPRHLGALVRPGEDEPARRLRRAFWYHLHPLRVTDRALRPGTTLGLGVITATLFTVLGVTGVALMVYYAPTQEGAFQSMLDIEHAVTFGAFVRALHRFAAHGMVLTVALHLVRVAAQAGYRQRELNWLIGLTLLALTLGLAFTGYLLPWDGRAYWAITVVSGMLDHLPLGASWKTLFLGGEQVGGSTLLRFYMLHVALLPALLLVLVALHFWRIRKDGGLAAEPAEAVDTLPAWPHLIQREAIVALLTVSAFALLAALWNAPLGSPADPHHPGNPEKAPWYFVWLQEAVSYSAKTGGIALPGLLALVLVLLPFLDRGDEAVGRWFGTGRTRAAALASLGIGAVTVFAALAVYIHLGPGGVLPELANPAGVLLAQAIVLFAVAGVWTGSPRAACLAALLVLIAGIAGLTVIGLCRGPDWAFFWPWEAWPRGV